MMSHYMSHYKVWLGATRKGNTYQVWWPDGIKMRGFVGKVTKGRWLEGKDFR